jgi:hypothetical protein
LEIDGLNHVGRGLGSKGLLGLGGQALGAAIQAECRSGSGKQDKGKRESHDDLDYQLWGENANSCVEFHRRRRRKIRCISDYQKILPILAITDALTTNECLTFDHVLAIMYLQMLL